MNEEMRKYGKFRIKRARRSAISFVCVCRAARRRAATAGAAIPGKVGRPPVVGKRLASLKQRLANPKTRWRRLLVSGWYGRGERMVEIVSAPPYGTTPAAAFPSAMSWCATQRVNLNRKPFSAPTSRRIRSTFFAGSSGAGRSRLLSPKSAAISASKPSGNRQNRQSTAPPRCCSACS